MHSVSDELFRPQEKQSGGKHELLKTLIALASLAVAVIATFANKDIPQWALPVLGGVVLFLLATIAWAPATWIYARYAAWRARRRAARMYFPDVAQMIRRLEKQLSDSYTNNLIYELRNVLGLRDQNGHVVLEHLNDFNRITEWSRLFDQKAAARRSRDFADVARSMNLAASQYWWICYGIQNRLQVAIGSKLLSDADVEKAKDAWNNGRESANAFFAECGALSDKINADMPESVGTVDRSSLKSIG